MTTLSKLDVFNFLTEMNRTHFLLSSPSLCRLGDLPLQFWVKHQPKSISVHDLKAQWRREGFWCPGALIILAPLPSLSIPFFSSHPFPPLFLTS